MTDTTEPRTYVSSLILDRLALNPDGGLAYARTMMGIAGIAIVAALGAVLQVRLKRRAK